MTAAPLPHNEVARLAALHALEVLDSPAEAEFDALVKVACLVCAVPISLISLVDSRRQWFKAQVGLPDLQETPRDIAFCAHAVHAEEFLEVPDAMADARFADNPLVLEAPGIRFYAGAPIRLSSGHLAGTLCVMDRIARTLQPEQREVLVSLCVAAARALETRASEIARFREQGRLQDILDGTGAGTWEWDMQSGGLQVNQRWAQILGRTLQDMLPVSFASWSALVHPDDFGSAELAVQAHVGGQTERYDCEFRMRHALGHWVWVHSSGQIKSWSPDGLPHKMFGTYVDITDRKRAQLLLELSETTQRLQYEATPAMLYSIDARGELLNVSNLFAQTLGYDRSDMLGRKPTDFMTSASARHALQTVFPEFLQTGAVRDVAYQMVRRDGSVMDVLVSAALERDAQGQPLRSLSVVNDVTERLAIGRALEQERRQLAQSEAHLRSVINSVPALIAYVDAQQRYVYVNQQYQQRFAPHQIDLIGSTVQDILGPERYAFASPLIERALAGQPQSYDWQPFHNVWQQINYLPTHSALGQVDGYYVLGTDITERKQHEIQQLEATAVFENSYEGIMVANAEGLITRVNSAFTRITGYTQDEVVGQSPRMLSSGRHDARFYAEFWQSLNTAGVWRGEIWNRRKSGELYAVLQSVAVVHDANGAVLHYVCVFADISQIKAHEAALDKVANYDPLTHLPNRRLLSDRLKQALVRSDRSGRSTAICFLDLDGFKLVNDQLGHAVGDLVLVGVAQHLGAVLRADDTLARLGGDEFVLLLSDIASTEECAQVLERVLEATRQPVQAEGHAIVLSASIGVSLYPSDHSDPDLLLRHADMAMYLAKQAGKDRYQLFDTEIDRVAQTHRDFLAQLECALHQQEFVLHYQPQVDLVSGQVIGAEALIRWLHPVRGLLAPAEFLPQLNGSALEAPLGEWVIATALAQMRSWKVLGLHTRVSVNISANHLLQSDFCARLTQALARYPDIEPSQLELEVLETAAIGDMQHAVEALQACTALGVRFALDDFGTGYSSLTYLRKLPVHTLKIDQSFVRDMLVDPDDLGIVRGTIELANIFGRQVVAEGVETMAHGSALCELGCRCVQGYGIARPMPADQLPAWCAAFSCSSSSAISASVNTRERV
jgi:diguanylate cyclase (GGDEF)-like protein/PAS domain S-box-containing protein